MGIKIFQKITSDLRPPLLVNGLFSLVTGLAAFLLSVPTANLIFSPNFTLQGLGGGTIILSIAVGLSIFAVGILYVLTRTPLSLQAVKAITLMDASWVVGSLFALWALWESFTAAGVILMTAQTLIVALLATLQFRALNLMNQTLT